LKEALGLPILFRVERELAFTVPASLGGERLDRALVALTGDEAPALGASRSRLQEWIRAGQVRVDGEVVRKANRVLEPGARIALCVPDEPPARDVRGAAIGELAVLFEDESLIVIDKPAGLVVHAAPGRRGESLVQRAVARWGELPAVQGEDRPGVVHRLDRLTSGVIVLGRTPEALEGLKRQFAAREVEKRYLALCHHVPRFDGEWIEAPLEKHPTNPARVRIARAGGRPAATFVEALERFRGFSLLRATPRTGRTHQIRVHLSHAGLSIVGDRTYRHPGALREPVPPEAPPVARQLLHAERLAFRHPASGERVSFEAAPPADFQDFLAWLRSERRRVE